MRPPPRALARALILLVPVALTSCAPAPLTPRSEPLVDLVDQHIGTGGFGFAYGGSFLGAAAPHGLLKVGPDTTGAFGEFRAMHTSGNWSEDPTILCFSHLHLHGTGLPEAGVVALMPTASFSPDETRAADYRATRSREVAGAGTYSVHLDEPNIDVALAAPGEHSASWRVTFPEGTSEAVIVLDLQRAITEGEVTNAQWSLTAPTRITGSLHQLGSLSPPGGYDVYFVIDVPREDDARTLTVTPTERGAALSFGARDASEPVELHVAVSYVSIAGAVANLEAELPRTMTHARAEGAAREPWRAILNRVRVRGGTRADQVFLATALYHAFLMPTVMSDVDGTWRGPDGENHARGDLGAPVRMMTDFSLWDTYRTVHPLYALIAPESARDSALSLVAWTRALSVAPLWLMATGDASVMVGSPAEIVLADALERGVVSADELAPAWDVLRAAALDVAEPAAGRGGRNGMPSYDANDGWLPPPYRGTVSNTLELNAADLSLSRIANALGHDDDAARLAERSHGWRALFDPDSGFLRSRNGEDGGFVIPAAEFLPEQFSNDYVEADAWQSLFPIDDLEGVRAVYGDPVARLADLLERSRADWDTRDPASDTAGLLPLPFHWQGNEPSLHVSGLPYDLGDDALGRRYVSWVMKTQYSTHPNGIPGNDDGGATSSWWALAAMGLFPVAGADAWVTGAPLFDETEIDVDGHTLTIVRRRDATGAARSIEATPFEGARVSHAALVGARVVALDP